MNVQGPNAAPRSHSNAASACQTSVPPGAKKPSVGLLLNELWLLCPGTKAISPAGTT